MKFIIYLLLLSATFQLEGQTIVTFAGTGSTVYSGNGVPASAAGIPDPIGAVFDQYGNYFFADAENSNRIRKIDTNGIITTIAGTGSGGFTGNGGPATNADLYWPTAVKIDRLGNLYICEGNNFVVRRINSSTGYIETFAGIGGVNGFSGDNGLATNAKLYNPQDICFDQKGNLYIADGFNDRIRKVDTNNIITTFAGIGSAGMAGDGGAATAAQFSFPGSIVADQYGNIYFSTNENTIRKVDTNGIITRIAGTGVPNYVGDNIPATAAQICPIKIGFDSLYQLYMADGFNKRVYMIDLSGILHLVAGNGVTGFSGDGGPATACEFNYPAGITFDYCGNLYIPEPSNRRIRKITFDSSCHWSPTIVGNETDKHDFLITPNPTTSAIEINGAKGVEAYAVFTLTGIVVTKGTLVAGHNTISLNGRSPGIYLLKIHNLDGTEVVNRVVKM